MAYCDESYRTWTPTSSNNNQGLSSNNSSQNEIHLVHMKESDTLLDPAVPRCSNLGSTEKTAAITALQVRPAHFVPSCEQTSKLTRPLATSTSN